MKKVLLASLFVASAISANAFALPVSAQEQPAPLPQKVQQSKTRAQVKAELAQAKRSGELKYLDETVYAGAR